jgi:hypothetical protein
METNHVPDDTPPHWSVTFAVDEANLIADRLRRSAGTFSCRRSMRRGSG